MDVTSDTVAQRKIFFVIHLVSDSVSCLIGFCSCAHTVLQSPMIDIMVWDRVALPVENFRLGS